MIFQLLTIVAFCQRNIKGAATLQKLVADDAVDGDYFGCSVSIYDTYAVIGAWTQDNHGINQYGAAYVFQRDTITNIWSQSVKLNASDASASALGFAVDIYSTSIVVGARHTDAMYGSSYVFELDSQSNTWIRTSKLQRNPNSGASYFGNDVAIYDQYIAVGTRNEAAYIFQRDSQSNTWAQTQKLLADDNVDGDYFASSLAIYGPYLVIGADSSDKNATTYQKLGSAYIFKLDTDTNTWSQSAKLTANERTYSNFGYSVAIYETTVLIGAYSDASDAGNNVGSAYVFELDAVNNSSWTQSAQLWANDPTAYANFGSSVAIYDTYAVIGAKGDAYGSAYVFELDSSTNMWTQTAKLEPSTGANYDYFGAQVSLYDKYAMVGMYGDVTGSAHAAVLIDYADTFTSDPSKASDSPTTFPSGSPSASPSEASGTPASDSPSGSPSRSPSRAPVETAPTESDVSTTMFEDESTESSTTIFDGSSSQMKTLLSYVISWLFIAAAILQSY